jgi:hypothetical protein
VWARKSLSEIEIRNRVQARRARFGPVPAILKPWQLIVATIALAGAVALWIQACRPSQPSAAPASPTPAAILPVPAPDESVPAPDESVPTGEEESVPAPEESAPTPDESEPTPEP